MERWMDRSTAEAEAPAPANGRRASAMKVGLIFLLLVGLPMAWRWTPLNHWINFETVLQWQESVKNDPMTFYLVVGTYLLGSLVLFPITILNVATVFAFGPLVGNAYALTGWLASAAMGYGIGRALGREPVQRLARSRLQRLIRPAERHGFLAVLTMRLFPIAPFTLVNFFVGASRIRFRDFFLASAVGRIPGIVVLTLAGVQVEYLLRSPTVGGVALLGLTLAIVPVAAGWLSRRLFARAHREHHSSERSQAHP
jgi:phospholipase D1/2